MRNKLLRVGDEVEGYTILSAKSKTGKRINPRTKKEEEGDISEIVIRKDEDSPKYTLVVDNKGYEDDYYAMFLFAYSRYDTRAAKKYVLKPGESLKLPHRATRSYETYTVESVTERKVMVKRQDKGVSPDTYEVKPFDRRKARELFLPRPQTRQGAGDMPGEGMGPGDGEGMMEMMPGQDGMAPGGRPGGRTSRRRRDAF